MNTAQPIRSEQELKDFMNFYADLPIDKIMELYNQSEKQIFIAFDKEDTFYDVTSDIVHSTKVIELHENGGELFGWSWAKKAAREKPIATETGVIEES